MDMLKQFLGKKQKGIQVFNIPQKKYCHDQKKLTKMDKKDLTDVINDMQKYIGHLCEKLQLGKKQFERSQQRCDQVVEKSKVINSQMARISNEHEQLQVKLTNLQSSLQMMTQQRQSNFSQQLRFIEQHELTKQKVKDFNKIFEIYQNHINVSERISASNKQLKQKYEILQAQYHDLSEKYNQIKAMPHQSQQKLQFLQSQTSQTETQGIPHSENTQAFISEIQKLKSILQGKQQMITSLNKQISRQKQKLKQNEDNLQLLNSDLQQILMKVSQKDDQLIKFRNENNQLNNLVNSLKRNQVKIRQNQDRLKEQIINLKNSVQALDKQLTMIKQKYFLSEESNHKMSIDLQKYKNDNEKKDNQLQNTKQKLRLYQQQLVSYTKASSQLQSKQNQISNLKKQIQKLKSKLEDQQKSIQHLQQDYQLKLRKVQANANQQRIKADALKRNLTILQTKDQQNKKDLDSMYENKIQQDGKIAQMQKKLKQYKHLIQYLKKQKIQLEKTFETKIKNMEEMVINENQYDDQVKQNTSLSASKQINANSPSPRIQPAQQYEKQAIITHKRIAQLEQQVDMLRQENTNLKMQKDQVELQKSQLQISLKSLTMKREQALRQIKKMSSIKQGDKTQKAQNVSNEKPDKIPQPSFRKPSEQIKSKQKRIAEKAYKGFDILAKLLSNLYKAFITVSDINKKQIKEIQSTINEIVRKSLDMKDIFQDYI